MRLNKILCAFELFKNCNVWRKKIHTLRTEATKPRKKMSREDFFPSVFIRVSRIDNGEEKKTGEHGRVFTLISVYYDWLLNGFGTTRRIISRYLSKHAARRRFCVRRNSIKRSSRIYTAAVHGRVGCAVEAVRDKETNGLMMGVLTFASRFAAVSRPKVSNRRG